MATGANVAPIVLTSAETAELLRVPVKTLYDWRERGYGPVGYRVGKYTRYERDAVLQWLREQPTSAPEKAPAATDASERVTIRPPRRRAS